MTLLLIFSYLLLLVFYVFFSYFQAQLARKAQLENPWFAYVPILNFLQILQLARISRWWGFSLFFFPLAVIITVWAFARISEIFGERKRFALLLLLPPVNVWALWHLVKMSPNLDVQDRETFGEIKKAIEDGRSEAEIKDEAMKYGIPETKFNSLYQACSRLKNPLET